MDVCAVNMCVCMYVYVCICVDVCGCVWMCCGYTYVLWMCCGCVVDVLWMHGVCAVLTYAILHKHIL